MRRNTAAVSLVLCSLALSTMNASKSRTRQFAAAAAMVTENSMLGLTQSVMEMLGWTSPNIGRLRLVSSRSAARLCSTTYIQRAKSLEKGATLWPQMSQKQAAETGEASGLDGDDSLLGVHVPVFSAAKWTLITNRIDYLLHILRMPNLFNILLFLRFTTKQYHCSIAWPGMRNCRSRSVLL
ncbi:hypothetical protein BP00DRAFT_198977 [Aspergillus indologenus CBS 114.80]|uniref:Uncharacterized protein n=1 Tax=Aspergillus indologenus CBS 114.80 TaxID=1450541 RepID=A0A2V5I1E0_9EURO|nr:hypothetical protein BP00DRAFT_198977 [Aspergillus indologenus CBS 114.80]